MEDEFRIANWIKVSVLGSGAFGVVSLWKNDISNEFIGKNKIFSIVCVSPTLYYKLFMYEKFQCPCQFQKYISILKNRVLKIKICRNLMTSQYNIFILVIFNWDGAGKQHFHYKSFQQYFHLHIKICSAVT